jgi:hypothetical protein
MTILLGHVSWPQEAKEVPTSTRRLTIAIVAIRALVLSTVPDD